MDPLKRILLLIGGIMSVSLGVVGIFVPLLPTVPFLLLAAYCFGRSSQRFHTWLLSSKPFGKMISDYKAGRGIPVSVKVVSITFLWLVIAVSVIWSLETTLSKIVVMLVGIAVTIHLMMLRSYR